MHQRQREKTAHENQEFTNFTIKSEYSKQHQEN